MTAPVKGGMGILLEAEAKNRAKQNEAIVKTFGVGVNEIVKYFAHEVSKAQSATRLNQRG